MLHDITAVCKWFFSILLSAQYRLDYSIMKQPGDCPSSDKWSPATDHPKIYRYYHYRNYCHHHCHCHCHYRYHYDPATAIQPKGRLKDDCYRSSCKFSVIFLDIPYIQDDDFLTEDVSRFTIPGILFTTCYLW